MTLNLSEFKKNGFVLFKGFFSGDEIHDVLRDVKQVFITQLLKLKLLTSEAPEEKEFEKALFELFSLDQARFVNCAKQAQHLLSLHRLSLDLRIEEVLKQLGLDFPNISTRPVLFMNSPYLAEKEVYWRTFPHQDWRSMQGSLDAVVVWVPLVDVAKPLGALEVVPESHKRGLLAPDLIDGFGKVDQFNDEDFVPLEVNRGDALFFNAFLVHRSGTNTTQSVRWACHFRYNNLAEETFVERGYPHPYIYRPQEALLTPEFPPIEMIDKMFSK
jgi:hypothetical protein